MLKNTIKTRYNQYFNEVIDGINDNYSLNERTTLS